MSASTPPAPLAPEVVAGPTPQFTPRITPDGFECHAGCMLRGLNTLSASRRGLVQNHGCELYATDVDSAGPRRCTLAAPPRETVSSAAKRLASSLASAVVQSAMDRRARREYLGPLKRFGRGQAGASVAGPGTGEGVRARRATYLPEGVTARGWRSARFGRRPYGQRPAKGPTLAQSRFRDR